jgi:ankyrin repeat protein
MLCDAAASGDVAKLLTLILQGAPINGTDYDKRTPMHLAASENQIAVMEALLSAGSLDLNPVDRFGGTPLMDAIRHGHNEAVVWLHNHGVQIDSKQQNFLSLSLIQAAATGHVGDIDRLLRHGALPSMYGIPMHAFQ